jgi:hypothetical protein
MLTRFFAWLLHLIKCLLDWFGHGKEPRPRNATLAVTVEDLTVPLSGPKGPVNGAEFSLVGEFDVDYLTDAGFKRLLDNLAASPGALKTVRVMKVLNSGTPEPGTSQPPTSSSGTVWPKGGSIDLSTTFDALAELTTRGLIPFVVLGFFPANVSVSPIAPPADYTNWTTLIQAFFDGLLADPRFGAAAISQWWFEVWNEPDNGSFWQGTIGSTSSSDYFSLYKATSDAVTAKGYNIRLGGPAIEGRNIDLYMQRFTDFLVNNPTVKCNFLSFHGKGDWNLIAPPDLPAVVNQADQTAQIAMAHANPGRFTGITIVNDEADMRVRFGVPFRPRMTEQFPAWLTALMITHDALSSQYSPQGFRFMTGSDNANLQLVSNAFDEKRSIMTAASAWTPVAGSQLATDLLKLPVYGFYELLRLLGDHHGTFISGAQNYYPNNSDLFHAITVAATNIGSVFCVYPNGNSNNAWDLNYSIVGISWNPVNVARFQIDHVRSNSYTKAGGPPASGTSLPFPAGNAGPIRLAQEIGVTAAIQSNMTLTNGTFHDTVHLDAYSTAVYWITPFAPNSVPATPTQFTGVREGNNVILRWKPNVEPFFYSYEVRLSEETITPIPLRAAIWVDTKVTTGARTYNVRAVSASGVFSGTASVTV